MRYIQPRGSTGPQGPSPAGHEGPPSPRRAPTPGARAYRVCAQAGSDSPPAEPRPQAAEGAGAGAGGVGRRVRGAALRPISPLWGTAPLAPSRPRS